MDYIKLMIHINDEDVEILSSYLFDLGCVGVEECSKHRELHDLYGEIYTFDETDIPNQGTYLYAYFSDHVDSLRILQDIKAYSLNKSIELFHIAYQPIKQIDYDESWKAFHQPIYVTDEIVVVPSWYEEVIKAKYPIIIEPGMGFGTGHHETTQMCLNFISDYVNSGTKMIDLGTGSGILAIFAKKLGADVVGIDLDEAALKNAYNNGLINQVEIDWTSKSLNELNMKVDVIVANLVLRIIKDLLFDIKASLKPMGVLILSGILREEEEDIIFEIQKDFTILQKEMGSKFIALVCQKR